MTDKESLRQGLIVHLAESMPEGTKLGRTALMKLAYFLQTLKGLPLGYHFSMYTYGPFDSDVLADLAQAQQCGGVVSEIVYHPLGYGYAITPGDRSDEVEAPASHFLQEHRAAIQSVINDFGVLPPATLELASTLVFASREAGGSLQEDELVNRVKKIKPRFTPEQIGEQLKYLKSKGYLPA